MHVNQLGIGFVEDANETLLIDVTLQTLEYQQYLLQLQVIEEPALVFIIHFCLEKEVYFVDSRSVQDSQKIGHAVLILEIFE